MSSRSYTTVLLRQGMLPEEIATKRDRAISTVMQHIRLQLGEGEIRPIEIVLIFNNAIGNELDELFTRHQYHSLSTFQMHAEHLALSHEEARLYYEIRESQHIRGDIYVFISDIELALHRFTKKILISNFGPEQSQWWHSGIPESVRVACASSLEKDLNPVPDPFSYTTLIHLSDIICDNSNWKTFRPMIPQNQIHDVKEFKRKLTTLNNLRNDVMHPVKGRFFRHAELTAIKDFHDLTGCMCRNAGISPPSLAPKGRKFKVHLNASKLDQIEAAVTAAAGNPGIQTISLAATEESDINQPPSGRN